MIRASQATLAVKNLAANAGDIRDMGSVPRLVRSPGGGHGNPLQDACLENPMDREARWWVHRVTKSWTWLEWFSHVIQYTVAEMGLLWPLKDSSLLLWEFSRVLKALCQESREKSNVYHDKSQVYTQILIHKHTPILFSPAHLLPLLRMFFLKISWLIYSCSYINAVKKKKKTETRSQPTYSYSG